jgi:hypothetical protein
MNRDVLERAKTLQDEGRDWEYVLAALRTDGFSIIDAIKATRVIQGVSLRTAKGIVHRSAAWDDRRTDFDAFHEDVANAFRAADKPVDS